MTKDTVDLITGLVLVITTLPFFIFVIWNSISFQRTATAVMRIANRYDGVNK